MQSKKIQYKKVRKVIYSDNVKMTNAMIVQLSVKTKKIKL